MTVPTEPKIYHIVHIDRLSSIIADKNLWCDAQTIKRKPSGTSIGMSIIKQRRLKERRLTSYPDLYVGDCVPFYFCPRSVMLYVIFQANHPDLAYHGGQEPIIHLEADLFTTVEWAKKNKRRWAFTLSNAGASYFEDRSDLAQLNQINWQAIHSQKWSGNGIPTEIREGKQAEFLMEYCFPWHLIERIGVHSQHAYEKVMVQLLANGNTPRVEITKPWYYSYSEGKND